MKDEQNEFRASSGKNHPSEGSNKGLAERFASKFGQKPPVGWVNSIGRRIFEQVRAKTTRWKDQTGYLPERISSKFGQKPPIGWVEQHPHACSPRPLARHPSYGAFIAILGHRGSRRCVKYPQNCLTSGSNNPRYYKFSFCQVFSAGIGLNHGSSSSFPEMGWSVEWSEPKTAKTGSRPRRPSPPTGLRALGNEGVAVGRRGART